MMFVNSGFPEADGTIWDRNPLQPMIATRISCRFPHRCWWVTNNMLIQALTEVVPNQVLSTCHVPFGAAESDGSRHHCETSGTSKSCKKQLSINILLFFIIIVIVCFFMFCIIIIIVMLVLTIIIFIIVIIKMMTMIFNVVWLTEATFPLRLRIRLKGLPTKMDGASILNTETAPFLQNMEQKTWPSSQQSWPVMQPQPTMDVFHLWSLDCWDFDPPTNLEVEHHHIQEAN